MKTQLLVLGGGPGGYSAAFLAADRGMDVTLVDREPRLGGTCLLRGCIPSKALLHVAKTIAQAEHLEEWGVHFPPPTIDLDALGQRSRKLVDTLARGLAQLAKKRKVRVLRAVGRFESSRTVRLEPVDDTRLEDDLIEFEHAILATGSRPTTLSMLDAPTERVMTSRSALMLADMPESLLVVGGGYIGLELGSAYAALGSRVSVAELTDGLLPGVDRDLLRPLARRLSERFEAIWLNTRVTGLTDRGSAIEVTFDGETPEPVGRFDRVLVCVGRQPNTFDLGLDRTNVERDERGFVLVDRQQRTAEAHIRAIGDITGEPMLAHKASHEGKVAVEALVGEPTESARRAIPAVVFTDPEIAYVGLTETEAQRTAQPVTVARFPWAASGRAHAVGRPEGLTKWLIEPDTERIVGCGIVGSRAGELISEAALALQAGLYPHDLTDTIHPHPTLSETLAGAAEVHFGIATDLYRPRR